MLIIYHPHNCIVYTVPVLEEIWIIGDRLINDSIKHQLELRKEFENGTRQGNLFIYQNFGVKIFTSSDQYNYSYVAQVRNAFVTALNAKHKIPRVVAIDNVIIPKQHDPSERLLMDLIYWLAKEVHRSIQVKLDQLPTKCLPKFTTKMF